MHLLATRKDSSVNHCAVYQKYIYHGRKQVSWKGVNPKLWCNVSKSFFVSFHKDVCTHMRKWQWIIQTIYNKHVWHRGAFQLDDRQTFMEKSWMWMWQQSPLLNSVFHWFNTITLQHKSFLQRHWISAAGHQRWEESQTGDIMPCRDWQAISQTLIVAECHFHWRTSSVIDDDCDLNANLEITYAHWLYGMFSKI